MSTAQRTASGLEIAVIGLAGRFPGAADVGELWRNLRDGVEGVRFFTAEELAAAGVPEATLADPAYVSARGVLADVDRFDAPFFDVPPREAELMDPQQRLFLQCAWEALEVAGYGRRRPAAKVGVYGGVGSDGYFLANLLSRPDLLASAGQQLVWIGNRADNLAPRVAYKLDLRGPALTVQTACSTSLVAVHLACQALLGGECELALAGGASIVIPQEQGYRHQAGNIYSPDGHCRPFDADAAGIVSGNGVGVVALKRLADARADGDFVWAVILGSALANDGAARVGYTAPGVEGQLEVVRAAQILAEVDPATISYVEAHGTGTLLGDPIEVQALTEAFRVTTDERGFCGLGSIKSNLGHLDAAAGVAGLIKTVLALHHRELPPTLHFRRPNPRIDFAASPFRVVAELTPWEPRHGVRRAAVSSFGIGGTNAHVIVEEAPPPSPSSAGRSCELLVWSARSEGAADAQGERLFAALTGEPEVSRADVAYTLQVGREPFAVRRAAVVPATGPIDREALRLWRGTVGEAAPEVVFLFPGQGSQYPGMARALHAEAEVFRQELDRCAERLRPRLGLDLRELILPAPEQEAATAPRLAQTALTQPALFALEWALARQWQAWGVEPGAMIGHSVGEYVAATLAGVFELGDALDLVAERGRLVQALPPGAMVSIPLPAAEVEPLLAEPPYGGRLEIAAYNAPASVVVGGPGTAVDALVESLAARGVAAGRLHTSHAFHTEAMEPALAAFESAVRRLTLRPPAKPWLSNASGDWIRPQEATDPAYWVRHLRAPVRFAEGAARLLAGPARAYLEVGPGRTLGSLVRRQAGAAPPVILASLPGPQQAGSALAETLGAAAGLWVSGVELRIEGLFAGQQRRRVPLPTYPFERHRYWVEPGRAERAWSAPGAGTEGPSTAAPDPAAAGVPGLAGMAAVVAEAWREILGVAPTEAGQSFYELGGDSLMATRVLSRLAAATGIELPLGEFLAAPTLGSLAAALESRQTGPEAAGDLAVGGEPAAPGRTDATEDLPLSFNQEQLWVLDQVQPGNVAYNMPAAFLLSGPLDAAALEAALRAILERHEVLRTELYLAGEQPRQRVRPRGPWRLRVADLGALGAGAEAALERLANAEAARPFELQRAPLLRALLVRLAPERHGLLVTIHHVCCDGWSWGVLFSELVDLYQAARSGAAPPLPELPVQYRDFALWQRRRLSGARLAAGLAYWRAQLARPLPEVELPSRLPRGRRSLAGAVRRALLPPELDARLETLVREEDATPFMGLLAAFFSLLALRSGQTDLVVGTDVAGRDRAELEGLIGFFVNQLVLRTRLTGDPSFREILRRTRQTTLEAFEHREVPFDRVVDALRPERSADPNPLFRLKLVLQSTPIPERDLGDLRLTAVPSHGAMAKFDQLWNLWRGPDGIAIAVEHSTDLYEASAIDLLLRDYELVLDRALAAPDAPLSRLEADVQGEIRARSRRRAGELKRSLAERLDQARRRGVDLHP